VVPTRWYSKVDLAQGPLAQYPETKFNGSIDYDAENSNWYIDATASYRPEGKGALRSTNWR
jgi:hypothetical protein